VPVKRRVPKRRVAELPDVCFRFLADLLEPGEEVSDEVLGLEFFHDPMSIEEAWTKYGAAAVAAHQAVHGPGSYPKLWHDFNPSDDDDGDGPDGGGGLPRAA
jgi:hypothetical protein